MAVQAQYPSNVLLPNYRNSRLPPATVSSVCFLFHFSVSVCVSACLPLCLCMSVFFSALLDIRQFDWQCGEIRRRIIVNFVWSFPVCCRCLSVEEFSSVEVFGNALSCCCCCRCSWWTLCEDKREWRRLVITLICAVLWWILEQVQASFRWWRQPKFLVTREFQWEHFSWRVSDTSTAACSSSCSCSSSCWRIHTFAHVQST